MAQAVEITCAAKKSAKRAALPEVTADWEKSFIGFIGAGTRFRVRIERRGLKKVPEVLIYSSVWT